jgi:hypothetical protein
MGGPPCYVRAFSAPLTEYRASCRKTLARHIHIFAIIKRAVGKLQVDSTSGFDTGSTVLSRHLATDNTSLSIQENACIVSSVSVERRTGAATAKHLQQ